FAPFGSTRPIPIAADQPVEALLPDTDGRLETLRDELTACVSITPPFDLAELAERYGPHPSIDPRDHARALELLARPGEHLGVATSTLLRAPPPALLARRTWSYAVCQRRREFLRAMHWWPQQGAGVVVHVGTSAGVGADGLQRLVAVLPTEPIVLL